MAKLLKKKSGFTLIELMIVVAILGILAALAVPAFITYVKRSKTGEAGLNLKSVFTSAASYYNRDIAGRGTSSTETVTKCIVRSTADTVPATPSANKQRFEPSATPFATLGFTIADSVYFGYGITSQSPAAEACGRPANQSDVYTFFANGDIDGDTNLSTFELAVGSNNDNELYRGVGFYVVAELE